MQVNVGKRRVGVNFKEVWFCRDNSVGAVG